MEYYLILVAILLIVHVQLLCVCVFVCMCPVEVIFEQIFSLGKFMFSLFIL